MAFDRVTIKYDGQFYEFDLNEMDLSIDAPTDEQILNATRMRLEELDVAAPSLHGYVVDPPEAERLAGQHNDKSVLNVRPTATYG